MKFKIVSLIISLFIWHYPGQVFAACNVSSTPVSFGSYNVFSSIPLDTTGTITLNCNETPPPTVTISIGQSTNSGSFVPRAMKLSTGSELLLYNLYTDAGRTTVWGDGSGETSTVAQKVFKKTPLITTVYGRVPPLQNIVTGTYNETLTVSIVW